MSHQTISFIKSGIRILGYFMLGTAYMVPAEISLPFVGLVLIISELIGIVEEIGCE